ncbi:MAG: HAMP domain-containing protein [Leptolyngbya sp. SIO1D8]|nr:HAMP domain-containing protein [Leptolyngbya sp. SIO1D8]
MFRLIKVVRENLLIQLISSFSLLSLVTLGVVAYSAYLQARNALEDSLYRHHKATATVREYELDQWFDQQRQEAIVLARSPIVLNTIDELLLAVNEGDLTAESIRALQNYFKFVLEVKTDIQSIEILSNGGIVALSQNPQDVGVYMGLGNTTTYFDPGTKNVVPNIYFSSITGKPTIRFATPISEGNERKAVLAITLNLEAVNQLIRQRTGLGETGKIYLVKEFATGNLFVSDAPTDQNLDNLDLTSTGIDSAIQGQDGQGVYRNHENVPVVGVYNWLENSNMALLVEVHQREAFEPAVYLVRSILILGIIAAGVLLVLVYLLARHIVRPVLTMTEAAEAMENDQFKSSMVNSVVKRPDELGRLARVFQQMADQIQAREAYLKAQVEAGSQQASGLELAYYQALLKKAAWISKQLTP